MSTTFDIIPSLTKDVAFGDVIDLATEYTHVFFKKYDIQKKVFFRAEILKKSSSETIRKTINKKTLLEWDETEYAWFTIDGVKGGTDAHCWRLYDEEDKEDKLWLLDELRQGQNFKADMEVMIEKSIQLDRVWNFRRSMGQEAVTNLCYGFLAAAVAELTQGFMHSTDCAWESRCFPCNSSNFLKTYFIPELTEEKNYSNWATRCIEAIRES
jgi:hypothetical protein